MKCELLAWNVASFTWRCDPGSRDPYYFTVFNVVAACTLSYLFLVLLALPDRRNLIVSHLAWNAVTYCNDQAQ